MNAGNSSDIFRWKTQFDLDPIDIHKLVTLLKTSNKQVLKADRDVGFKQFISQLKQLSMKTVKTLFPKTENDKGTNQLNYRFIAFKLIEFFSSKVFLCCSLDVCDDKIKLFYSPLFELFSQIDFTLNLDDYWFICSKMNWKITAFFFQNRFKPESDMKFLDDVNCIKTTLLCDLMQQCFFNYIKRINDEQFKIFLLNNEKDFIGLFEGEDDKDFEINMLLAYWLHKKLKILGICEELVQIIDSWNLRMNHNTNIKTIFIEEFFFIATEGQRVNQTFSSDEIHLYENWIKCFCFNFLKFLVQNIHVFEKSCSVFNSIIVSNVSIKTPDESLKIMSKTNFFWKAWIQLNNDKLLNPSESIDLILEIINSIEKNVSSDFYVILCKKLLELNFIILVYNRLDDVDFYRQLISTRINRFGIFKFEKFSYKYESVLSEQPVAKFNGNLNQNSLIKCCTLKILFYNFIYAIEYQVDSIHELLTSLQPNHNRLIAYLFNYHLNDICHCEIEGSMKFLLWSLVDVFFQNSYINMNSYLDFIDQLSKHNLIDMKKIFINLIGNSFIFKDHRNSNVYIRNFTYLLEHLLLNDQFSREDFEIIVSCLLKLLIHFWFGSSEWPMEKLYIIKILETFCEKCSHIDLDLENDFLKYAFVDEFSTWSPNSPFRPEILLFYIGGFKDSVNRNLKIIQGAKDPGLLILAAIRPYHEWLFDESQYGNLETELRSFKGHLENFSYLMLHPNGMIFFTPDEFENVLKFMVEIYKVEDTLVLLSRGFFQMIRERYRYLHNYLVTFFRSIMRAVDNYLPFLLRKKSLTIRNFDDDDDELSDATVIEIVLQLLAIQLFCKHHPISLEIPEWINKIMLLCQDRLAEINKNYSQIDWIDNFHPYFSEDFGVTFMEEMKRFLHDNRIFSLDKK